MNTTRQPLAVGPVTAQPGTRATGLVPLDLGGGASVEIPLALVHGAGPGPASRSRPGSTAPSTCRSRPSGRWCSALDPAEVRGSIVAVLTASPAAFAARSIYVNPLDGRNLNRCFPGDAAGSPTERLARWLTDHVIAGSDAFLDMHCGDMNEALVSFTGIEDTGDAAVDARSRELADAYGLRYLLIGPSPGTTTTAAAALGIPAVLAEVGGQGRWPAEDVALHAAGLRRWLRAAGVLADAPDEPRHATEVLPTEAWMRAHDDRVLAPRGRGRPARSRRARSSARCAMPSGTVLERPAAPIDGVVIFLVTSLAMNAGDPLLALAG